MGRDCSNIMDIFLAACDELVGAFPYVLDMSKMDEIMGKRVRELAAALEDLGWDTQEEVDNFWRFPQEIMRYDDVPFEAFLRHKLTEATHEGTPEDILAAAQRLKAHTDKMKAGNA